jgi:predicted transcriptional regulator
MIDNIEYNLNGSEFKLLQYFKDNPKIEASKIELAKILKISDRAIYRAASNLEHLNIIEIEKNRKINNRYMPNIYRLQNKKEWKL